MTTMAILLINQKNFTRRLHKKGYIRININKMALNNSREIKIIIDRQVTQVYSLVIEHMYKTSPNTCAAFTRFRVQQKVTQPLKYSLSIRRNTK